MTQQVLILTGDGINCENETKKCCEMVGLKCRVVQVNDLLSEPEMLHAYQCLIIPGGFSFGDDLGSGKIFARKIERKMGPVITKFLADKKLILGICNGFQVLTTLGLFNSEKVAMALDENTTGHFINRWESVTVGDSVCLWTKSIVHMKLPIRHGEGRVIFTKESSLSASEQYKEMKNYGQIVMTYDSDPNGSYEKIAGVCDESGQVFGLMPHPEAARADFLYPGHAVVGQLGLSIFENMKNYLKETF